MTRTLGRECQDIVKMMFGCHQGRLHHDDHTVFSSPVSDFVLEWERRSLPGTLRLVGRGERVSLAAD